MGASVIDDCFTIDTLRRLDVKEDEHREGSNAKRRKKKIKFVIFVYDKIVEWRNGTN